MKAGKAARKHSTARRKRARAVGRELARLQASTASYYDALTPAKEADDAALARASAAAARRLMFD
jgi:hypothetical protein